MERQQMVRLGKSGLEVTAVGFGGIPIQRLTEVQAVRVLRRALDGGMNWIDTAHGYSTSEGRVGKAIQGYRREKLHLFTKGPAREPQKIREQIELSLQRLQTPYIDLYQFHAVPSMEEWEEMGRNGTLEVVREYRQRGAIRHIGASTHSQQTAEALARLPEIEVLQYPFNFIVQREGLAVLKACREHDVGFIAMKPFGGGALESAPACIRFLLQHPGVAADPGFEKEEEVGEVLALWQEGARLSAEDRGTIERLREELGKRFCRRCGYCMPCPQGVQISSLMTMASIIKRFPSEWLGKGWVAEAGRSAELCTECGECEGKCPYELPVVEEIQRGARLWQEAARAHG
jgi:predicted aldo/keto reductase-like oxidoreductase